MGADAWPGARSPRKNLASRLFGRDDPSVRPFLLATAFARRPQHPAGPSRSKIVRARYFHGLPGRSTICAFARSAPVVRTASGAVRVDGCSPRGLEWALLGESRRTPDSCAGSPRRFASATCRASRTSAGRGLGSASRGASRTSAGRGLGDLRSKPDLGWARARRLAEQAGPRLGAGSATCGASRTSAGRGSARRLAEQAGPRPPSGDHRCRVIGATRSRPPGG